MKIISGTVRGCKLLTPRKNNFYVRPTISYIREAIFSIIGTKIGNSLFLDLYSGTGAIGIEALSRGAYKSFFVDKSKVCSDIIKFNLTKTKFINQSKVFTCTVNCAIKSFIKQKNLFDIIFMDPPYDSNLIKPTLNSINKFNLLARDGIIICEMSTDESILAYDGFTIYKSKRYGGAVILFLRSNNNNRHE